LGHIEPVVAAPEGDNLHGGVFEAAFVAAAYICVVIMAAGVEGVQLPVPLELQTEFLWQALEIKVLHPDEFLPVSDVKVRRE
jgi:hypothetical protein